MRTIKLSLLVLVVALGWLLARAVTVSPYTETFAGVDFTEPDCAPDGWGHIVEGRQVYELLENVEGVGTCLYIDYQTSDFPTYNMFVTPAVGGMVTLQAMYAEAQFGQPWLKFFYCTRNQDGTFTQGAAITQVQNFDTLNQQGFTTLTIADVPQGSYIGIAGSYVLIANFTATTAEVEKVDRRELKVAEMQYLGPEQLDMADGNTYTVPVSLVLRNIGNVDLMSDDPDFTVSLITTDGAVVDTQDIDIDLPRATETESMLITFNVDGNVYGDLQTFYVQENVSGTHHSDYIQVISNRYEPRVQMLQLENGRYVDLPSGSTIDFGQTQDIVTREFYINNTGAAPFAISEFSCPDGFVSLTQAGDTVPAHEAAIVVIAMDNSTPGLHEGELVLRGNTVEEFRLTLTGTVIDDSQWFVDFEDGFPADMIPGAIWRTQSYDGTQAAVAQTWQGSQYEGEGRYLISPKLEIKAGEALHFQMAKSSYYVPDLNVYFSTDRKNWTLVKDYVSSDFDRTTIGYNGECRFTDMTLDNFEPSVGYVMFEGFAVALDNVRGFTVVPVEHDLMVIGETLPTQGEVNSPLSAQLTVKNYGPTEAAGTYTATLLVDGQPVATAEAVEMAAGAATTFDFTFTPHQAGTFPIVAKITMDDYELASSEGTLTIQDEVVSSEIAVGDATTTSTITGGAPVDPSEMYQVSEIIYPAGQIQLAKGAKITRIAFKGRNTGSSGAANIQAWIENTTDSQVDNNAIHPTTDMTQIMDREYTFLPGGSAGMNPTHADMLVIELAEPFVYDGTNLRLRFHSQRTRSCTVRYQYDDNAGVAVQQSSYNDQFSYYRDCEVPVMYLSTVKEPTTVSGIVTDAATGSAIAGADVRVCSGDVLYAATTQADGSYAVEVKKDFLTDYTLTATAAGYKPFTTKIDITVGNVVMDIQLHRDAIAGDVTGDGNVDIEDVNALINVILELTSAESLPGATDIDGDGATDIADVNALINMILQ